MTRSERAETTVANQMVGLLIAAVLAYGVANGQRKSSSPPRAHMPALDSKYLHRGFLGDDIAQMYDLMYDLMGPKNEYESSEQYRARFDKAYAKYKSQDFFIRVKPPHMPGVNNGFYLTKYDADANELIVDIPSIEFFGTYEMTVGGSVRASKYKARNSFGVATTVTRYLGDRYVIVFDWARGGIRVRLKMSPQEAKLARDRISILLVGTPAVRGGRVAVSYKSTAQDPTLTNPFEDLTLSHQINMNIRSIWLYDRVTMKVLTKAENR